MTAGGHENSPQITNGSANLGVPGHGRYSRSAMTGWRSALNRCGGATAFGSLVHGHHRSIGVSRRTISLDPGSEACSIALKFSGTTELPYRLLASQPNFPAWQGLPMIGPCDDFTHFGTFIQQVQGRVG